jgi:FlgD Ig-like domain
MKRFTMFACMMVAMVFALVSFAGKTPTYVDGHNSVIFGGSSDMTKAGRDTVVVIGPWSELPAGPNGQFQDPESMGGGANWNGWTSVDYTVDTEKIWHVDTYNVVNGTYSAWCGEIRFEVCGEGDVVGGYGQNYHELLVFRGSVADNTAPCSVAVTATVNHNTEAGWDYVHLGYFKAELAIERVWSADGIGVGIAVSQVMAYAGGEYVGDNNDEVRIAWQVLSDGAADDSDCQYPTNGAMQVDDITVTMDNDVGPGTYFDDFEDNTLGNWVVEFPLGVGDYSHIRTDLKDADDCLSNYTPAMCFLADDIMAAQGLPAEIGYVWTYGNGGYVVNTQGGLAGIGYRMHNVVISPPAAWPPGYPGGSFEFDVYRHFELGVSTSGMFYVWAVRSTTGTLPEDLDAAPWVDRGYVYYGGPDWIRGGDRGLISLLEPGTAQMQVRMGVKETITWGWSPGLSTPAPFFDNVRVLAFDQAGPGLTTREIDLANDNFPANQLLSTGVDYGDNDIRFDMARDISLQTEAYNLAGDTIVVEINPVRADLSGTQASLVATDVPGVAFAPRLMFSLKGNPTFDAAVRTFQAEADWAALGGVITSNTGVHYEGYTYGTPAFHNGVQGTDGEWAFDLPDENFLYPGDVLHYYVEAWDVVGASYEGATVPGDLDGFGDFSGPLAYNSRFTVRGLPTLFDTAGDQPRILFWNDFGDRGGQAQWHGAFESLGLFAGADYDVFYTNGPSSGVGNGIGGRAVSGQLAGYDVICYSSGDLASFTISNQNFVDDAGDDAGVIDSWLGLGGKMLFATGDDIASDMEDQGGIAATLLSGSFGVLLGGNDVGEFLGGDIAPDVTPFAGNSVFATTTGWTAYGGCPGINTFDAVTPLDAGTEVLAYFNDGATSKAAATRKTDVSTVIYLPYDLMNVRSPMKANQPASLAARAQVLEEVLFIQGILAGSNPSGNDVPGSKFGISQFPNPFNPATKIEFNMPKAGHLSLKVYTVRGELVRTLVNEVRAEGSDHVMWDGTSDQGKRVSSGVYFYEAITDSDSAIGKMVMLK